MRNAASSRFSYIGHALRGDGPFRPYVTYNGDGSVASVASSYLVRYPRESTEKYARRNELAVFASPLAQHTGRFCGYIAEKSPLRDVPHQLYKAMIENADGKGNSLDIFWQDFMLNAKARGSMLLLVDMPRALPATLAGQITNRAAPYLTAILPETVTEYALGEDGRFTKVTFSGTYTKPSGETIDCSWSFSTGAWSATDSNGVQLDAGTIPINVCPVLIFTEQGDFPCFGPFSPIADLSRDLFNATSELREILRAQTFSLLTMQVPEGTTNEQKIDSAKAIGVTIGTSNLMVHSGQTPAFIAPPGGPASTYLEYIRDLRSQIEEVGLAVASPNQQESGISMQMRFHSINAALARFTERMEDFERRMWELSSRWLNMQAVPTISWPRDFDMADVEQELTILTEMNANAMPKRVIEEQQKRITSLQFVGAETETKDELLASIEEQSQERSGASSSANDNSQEVM